MYVTNQHYQLLLGNHVHCLLALCFKYLLLFCYCLCLSALCLSPLVPGLLVTGSADDTIKFWDIEDDKPTFLFNRDMHMVSLSCAESANPVVSVVLVM